MAYVRYPEAVNETRSTMELSTHAWMLDDGGSPTRLQLWVRTPVSLSSTCKAALLYQAAKVPMLGPPTPQ